VHSKRRHKKINAEIGEEKKKEIDFKVRKFLLFTSNFDFFPLFAEISSRPNLCFSSVCKKIKKQHKIIIINFYFIREYFYTHTHISEVKKRK
jgi:hypothetical protein